MFTLNQGNSDLSPFPGPYGTVTVNRTSTTGATVSFVGNTVTSGGHTFVYKFGATGAADVNVNGTADTTIVIPSSLSPDGSKNISDFGTLSNTTKNDGGATQAFSSGIFLLTATGGTTWSTAGNVLKADGSGFQVAAHIFVFEDGSTDAIKTGFSGGVPVATPEFGSITLMCLMLLGLGGESIRRLQKLAVA
jgi:hypothetical protein